jgi:hypothetical protein
MAVKYTLETPRGLKYDVEFDEEPTPEMMDSALKDIARSESDTGQDFASSLGGAAVRGGTSLMSSTVQGLGALIPGGAGDIIRDQGKILQGDIEAAAPVNPAYEDTMPVKSVAAAAQGAAFLGVGLMSGGSSIPALAVAGLSGAGGGADTAEQLGFEGWRKGLLTVGGAGAEIASESLFGIGSSQFLKGAGKPAVEFGKAVFGEGIEEPYSGFLQDLTRDIASIGTDKPMVNPLDPKKRWDEFFYGTVGATLFGGVAAVNANKLRNVRLFAQVDGQTQILPTNITEAEIKKMGLDPANIRAVNVTPEIAAAIDSAPTDGTKATLESVLVGAAGMNVNFDLSGDPGAELDAMAPSEREDENQSPPATPPTNEEERQREGRQGLQVGDLSNVADLGTPMGDITTDFGPLRTPPETTNPATEGSAPGGVGDLGASTEGPATGSSAPAVSIDQGTIAPEDVNPETPVIPTVETIATSTVKAPRNVNLSEFRDRARTEVAPTPDIAPEPATKPTREQSKTATTEDEFGTKNEYHQINLVENENGDLVPDLGPVMQSLKDRAKQVKGKVHGKKFLVRVDEERAEFNTLDAVKKFLTSVKGGSQVQVYRNGNNQVTVDFEADIPKGVFNQQTTETPLAETTETPVLKKVSEYRNEKNYTYGPHRIKVESRSKYDRTSQKSRTVTSVIVDGAVTSHSNLKSAVAEIDKRTAANKSSQPSLTQPDSEPPIELDGEWTPWTEPGKVLPDGRVLSRGRAFTLLSNPVALPDAREHVRKAHGLTEKEVDIISDPLIVARGWFDHKTGRPVVNTAWLHNTHELSETLYHEITHRIERDPAFTPHIRAAMQGIPADQRKMLGEHLIKIGYSPVSIPTEAQATVISEMANAYRAAPWWRRLVAQVKSWWRRVVGSPMNETDAAVLSARIMARAAAQMREGKPVVSQGNVRRSQATRSESQAEPEVKITARKANGDPVEITMKAADAEAMLTKRQSVLQALIDCLNG